jgi:ABC-2 type transport system permease protein
LTPAPAFAIFRRELSSYFGNPTGYVFITIFVFMSAAAAFWQPDFFAANLANLDPLNRVFAYLLLFLVPAIAMGLWADERRHGTDELLLTLPATDRQIVAGKYLAALAIYTVALVFSLSHAAILAWLGRPDLGLLASTYIGYWLMGAALLALGMLASILTDNLTVAFILGAVTCAIPVFLHNAEHLLGSGARRLAERLSFAAQFRDLASGVITLSSLVYFIAFAIAMLHLNVVLLGRRRWPGGRPSRLLGAHHAVRAIALLTIVGSLTVLAGNTRVRLDVTTERLHSLAPQTRALIDGLDARHPVFIQAYLSPEVPNAYLETRRNLTTILRELDVVGAERIHARIHETRKYSARAREARERYDIRPTAVRPAEETAGTPREIYLGLVFACGAEEFVIPFFDRGLPVEYELMRSIRVVSRAKRRSVGILRTAVDVFGGFDFASRRQRPEWSIVRELRKQYVVSPVDAGKEYPADLDVLIAPLPTTINPSATRRLTEYAQSGRPLLALLDPLPAFDLSLSPSDPPASPFGPPPERPARGDIRPLLRALGVKWRSDRVLWDTYNPHPQLRNLPPEIVFIGPGNGADSAFSTEDPVSSGLQELVLLYPGTLEPRIEAASRFVPLASAGPASGLLPWSRLVVPSFFGVTLASVQKHEPDARTHVVAARVKRATDKAGSNAIIVADADMMGEQFFELHRRGIEQLRFDNVTFLLNAVDALAGDSDFIELRKRRPRHRTLEAVEAKTRRYEERRREEMREAEAFAQRSLEEAQRRMDEAVRSLERRADLDEQTRQIMLENLRAVENRRLTVARANIEDEKARRIEDSRTEMESSIRAIQNAIKVAAVTLPPVPAFLLFLFVTARRLKRERIGASARLLNRGRDSGARGGSRA